MSDSMSPNPSAPGAGNPASVARLFKNRRHWPSTFLPWGYEWGKQKKLYSPRNLLGRSSKRALRSEFGFVFCHRGLYERASSIVENSSAAIENGIKEGVFLHEIDGFVPERLDSAPVAHDEIARRVTRHNMPWNAISAHERFKANLVTRNIEHSIVDPEIPDQPTLPSQAGTFGPPDFASSYLNTDETVLALFDVLWKEKFEPSGLTLQYDLRNNDLANAIPYYAFHLSKLSASYKKRSVAGKSLVRNMFQSVILKGYNVVYKSFDHLVTLVEAASCAQYELNNFERKQLPLFPPMIMVFHAEHIVKLARETKPANPGWDIDCYEHIYDIAKKQIMSYVDIPGTGDGDELYSFILEITHSGLGLGYSRGKNTAKHPIDGTPILSNEILLESRADRVLIDIAVELRESHPKLLFSSCTRLPDVILEQQDAKENKHTKESKESINAKAYKPFKANWNTSRLDPWKDGESGISAEMRTIHGGLYPQSNIVVADDPMAEMAARTWIDQEFKLDRSELLSRDVTYYEWLKTASGREDLQGTHDRGRLVDAVKRLNKPFDPNKFGETIRDLSPSLPRPSLTMPVNWILQWKAEQDEQENFENPRRVDTGDLAYQEIVGNDRTTGDGPDEQPAFKVRVKGSLNRGIGAKFPRDAHRALSMLNDQAELRAFSDTAAATDEHVTEISVGDTTFRFVSKNSAFNQSYGSESQRAAFGHNHGRLEELVTDPTTTMSDPEQHATKLGIACEKGHLEIIDLLLDQMTDINIQGLNGYPLVLACAKGPESAVRKLLDRGVKVNIPSVLSSSPLAVACGNGRKNIASLLLDRGADLTFESIRLLVAQAARNGQKDIVEMLFHYQMRRSGSQGPSKKLVAMVLHDACQHGQSDLVHLLLEKVADVNSRGSWPGALSPLEAACLNGHMETVLVLLKHNAAINLMVNGFTALHIACGAGQYAVAKLLLDKHASFKDCTWHKLVGSPLRQAYIAGNTSIVKLLLEKGAPPDIADYDRPPNAEVALLLDPVWAPPSDRARRRRRLILGLKALPSCGCLVCWMDTHVHHPLNPHRLDENDISHRQRGPRPAPLPRTRARSRKEFDPEPSSTREHINPPIRASDNTQNLVQEAEAKSYPTATLQPSATSSSAVAASRSLSAPSPRSRAVTTNIPQRPAEQPRALGPSPGAHRLVGKSQVPSATTQSRVSNQSFTNAAAQQPSSGPPLADGKVPLAHQRVYGTDRETPSDAGTKSTQPLTSPPSNPVRSSHTSQPPTAEASQQQSSPSSQQREGPEQKPIVPDLPPSTKRTGRLGKLFGRKDRAE